MATEAEWQSLRWFKRTGSDNWGDPDLMDFELLKKLDQFRTFLNKPVLVTCGTSGKHVDGSEHYHGRAVDVVFPEKGSFTLLDCFFVATRFFTGIGLYPHWGISGRITGGMHLDYRPVRPDQYLSLWMGIIEEDPSNELKKLQKYVPLNEKNLRLYGVI